MTSQTSQLLMRRISKASKFGRTSLVEGSRKNILVASFGCRNLSLPSKSSNKSETNLDSLYLQFTKNYGTRSSRIFSSEHAANQFVRWLLPDERSALLAALKEYQSENEEVGTEKFQPSMKQLKMVAISNAIPFIGFGFLDNAIMILAGEYIDHTIGLTLGISTMAAAAVGNLISDIMGLGLAGYVEAIAIKLGFDVPPMSTRQASMWKTKYTAYLGRGVGIMIGCIIGMFPLLLIDATEEEEEEHVKEKSTILEFEDDITNDSRKRHVANGDVVQKKV